MPLLVDDPLNKRIVSTVNVAVAVIHYQDRYLLGFRNAKQHQGNRYEFVGGKIESDERPEQALIREVAEETGINLIDHTIVKLGRLHHDYGDKQVVLHVYKSALTALQYEQHKRYQYGLEGQALTWVNKAELLAEHYPLPAANKTILVWLRVPEQITITYPLAHFIPIKTTSSAPQILQDWLDYHQRHIAKGAWTYIRPKSEDFTSKDGLNHQNIGAQTTDLAVAEQLIQRRPDILTVAPISFANRNDSLHHLSAASSQTEAKISHIAAWHVTHKQIITWCETMRNSKKTDTIHARFPVGQPLIISCHDMASIQAANLLAVTRLKHNLAPVLAIFLSPVHHTNTHPKSKPLGWEEWQNLAELADMPVISLGGLSPNDIKDAVKYGGVSVAGIRQFLNG